VNSRAFLAFGLACTLIFLTVPVKNPSAEPCGGTRPCIYDPVIVGMISKFSEAQIYHTAYDLQNFTTRRFGTASNTNAGTYLFNRLNAIPGLTVEYQSTTYKNIVATLPGSNPGSDAIYVVGAHYDSFSYTPGTAPGAMDDGGGIGIVLEYARIMSQYTFNDTIKFACWNDEEDGCYGSAAYASWAKSSSLNIALNINYDSTCYDPSNNFVLDITYETSSMWVSDMETQYNTLYSIGFSSIVYNGHHGCGGDHESFTAEGFLAVSSHQEIHGPHYHQADDIVDYISTAYARKNGQLGMSVIAKLAGVLGVVPELPFIVIPACSVIALFLVVSRRKF
jgi:hypothetical protein